MLKIHTWELEARREGRFLHCNKNCARIIYQQALAITYLGGSIISEVEKLQEMLNCINENPIVLASDQQKIYILLEKIDQEIKKE